MTAFGRRVLHLLRRIPPGRVATYGDVARLSGRPGAARAVGNILRQAAEPGLPYHRVVAAAGRIGGFGRHPQVKIDLLAAEGHTIRRGRIVRFPAVRWPGNPTPPRPVQSLSDRGTTRRPSARRALPAERRRRF